MMLAWHARSATLVVITLAVSGCSSDEPAPNACVSEKRAALYFGTANADLIELSAAQKNAIGIIQSVTAGVSCTGIAVLQGWAITAAHCNLDDIAFKPATTHASTIAVLSTIVHPSEDIMLMELAANDSLELTSIPRWQDVIGRDWVGQHATLAGTGLTEMGTVGALRFVTEPIVDVTEREIFVDGMGQSGACSGDSGGPLLVAAADGSPRVLGILDRGSDDCLGVDVFVRVDSLDAWIGEATGTHCVSPSKGTKNF